MSNLIQGSFSLAAKWSNENQGVLSLGIFLTTLFIGWSSGIFRALQRKPRFILKLIDGPTFSCTFPTGKMRNGFPVHRTAIALYLDIANVGSSPSSICSIWVGYHWNLNPYSIQWLKYCIGWFWLHEQATILNDFQYKIGKNIKVFPFLIQANFLSPVTRNSYLEVGQSSNGVIYFEQEDSWGGCFPRVEKNSIKIKVAVFDAFNHRHCAKFRIPCVPLDEARKYNPSFGKTHAELQQETLPFDTEPNA
jgi:hypothetical protein